MAVQTDLVKAKQINLQLLDELVSPGLRQDIGVRFWDGNCWPDERARRVTLVLNHPGALREMFLSGTELAMAEAYLYNDVDIEGEIEVIFQLGDVMLQEAGGVGKKIHLARLLWELPPSPGRPVTRREPLKLSGKRHSLERDRQAVTYHYNVSNDFYSLYLDHWMVYSCAYFYNAEESLDQAQENKLDYLCRKLRLKPGQRLLDVGCGWGGLVIWAATHYNVDAVGITLSQPQAELANQRIAQLGLSERARVLLLDYRQAPEEAPFDALVSVGMFEHVGAERLPAYFEKALRLVKPGGVFLNHGIAGREGDSPLNASSFSEAYVFPDGELTPIHFTLHCAEKAGFEVRDVESLREHYLLTLRNWVKRLEANHNKALQYVDETTYRVWRLYMSGSAHGFKTRRLNVYQSLLVRPDLDGSSGLPLRREDWYRL